MIKQIQQFLIKVLFLIQYGIPLIPGLPAQLHGNLYEINHNLLESLLQQISGASPWVSSSRHKGLGTVLSHSSHAVEVHLVAAADQDGDCKITFEMVTCQLLAIHQGYHWFFAPLVML